ncbi:hypothetical protein [Marinobacter shengliensis]|uniref:hypothetical protein n=1 Tax=Marinobacter shengliensis TaxID=1389223 RepID=UPI0011081179|nr:hypothetical protein [Marinobacter shengliensis]
MIKHLIEVGQEELREELSLLVRLNRAILNFHPRHSRTISARYKNTFFLDQAFCNQLGFYSDDDAMVIGLPAPEFDLDVYDAFSKIQTCCGFLVHPLEYLFLVTHAGNQEARQTNTIAIALPLPRALHDNLAQIGKITFAKMNEGNRFDATGALTDASFEIEVRRDRNTFWEPAKKKAGAVVRRP